MDLLERKDSCIVIHRLSNKDDYSIGSIHLSNNCGLFRIVSYNGMGKIVNGYIR